VQLRVHPQSVAGEEQNVLPRERPHQGQESESDQTRLRELRVFREVRAVECAGMGQVGLWKREAHPEEAA